MIHVSSASSRETSDGRAREIVVWPWRVANTSRFWIRTITIFRRKVGTQVAYLDANPDLGMAYMPEFLRGRRPAFVSTRQTTRQDQARLSSQLLSPYPHDHVVRRARSKRKSVEMVSGFDEDMQCFEDIDLLASHFEDYPDIAGIDEIGAPRPHSTPEISAKSLGSRIIASAIDYVCHRKLMSEDKDMDPIAVIGAGTRHLYEIYGRGMLSVNALNQWALG